MGIQTKWKSCDLSVSNFRWGLILAFLENLESQQEHDLNDKIEVEIIFRIAMLYESH